ncbi:MAG: type II toxin-antitoxin system RelE/ParE family toxin [bacterium]|nr:type II toxin-antitoxin system RelE/ParE family toxin [bacterium]
MDKIEKALQKLSDKERLYVKELLSKLYANKTKGLDIAKLKGHDNIFRLKKGRMRIIFQTFDGSIILLKIDRRSDTTYDEF